MSSATDFNSTSPHYNALAHLSPALDAHLLRLFQGNPDQYLELAELFNYCCANGGKEEAEVIREPDASFNPRAARIAQLLIATTSEGSAVVLGAAFLASVDDRIRDSARHCNQSCAIAKSASAIMRSFSSHGAKGEDIAIAQASILDTVRHLHVSRRNQEQRAQILDTARKLADITQPNTRYASIIRLLKHAIAQQERRCARS